MLARVTLITTTVQVAAVMLAAVTELILAVVTVSYS